MYAVIESGGKQYRVAPGQTVEVERLPGAVGTTLTLGRVLWISPQEQTTAAQVRARIVAQGRRAKVTVFKFKPKKQYKRTAGHRQDFTRLMIEEIRPL